LSKYLKLTGRVDLAVKAIPYLFERFYRAKNVTIAEIPGSGIGLYIVKSIVVELGAVSTWRVL
jgi:signal transduction histidine kinase